MRGVRILVNNASPDASERALVEFSAGGNA